MAHEKDIENIVTAVVESELELEEKKKVIDTLSNLTRKPRKKSTWLNNNVASVLAIVVVLAAVITWFPIGVTIPIELNGYINSALILVLSYFFGSAVNGSNDKFGM